MHIPRTTARPADDLRVAAQINIAYSRREVNMPRTFIEADSAFTAASVRMRPHRRPPLRPDLRCRRIYSMLKAESPGAPPGRIQGGCHGHTSYRACRRAGRIVPLSSRMRTVPGFGTGTKAEAAIRRIPTTSSARAATPTPAPSPSSTGRRIFSPPNRSRSWR